MYYGDNFTTVCLYKMFLFIIIVSRVKSITEIDDDDSWDYIIEEKAKLMMFQATFVNISSKW